MQQSCTAIGNRGNSQAHKANSLDEDGRAYEQKANRIRIRLDTSKEFQKSSKHRWRCYFIPRGNFLELLLSNEGAMES